MVNPLVGHWIKASSSVFTICKSSVQSGAICLSAPIVAKVSHQREREWERGEKKLIPTRHYTTALQRTWSQKTIHLKSFIEPNCIGITFIASVRSQRFFVCHCRCCCAVAVLQKVCPSKGGTLEKCQPIERDRIPISRPWMLSGKPRHPRGLMDCDVCGCYFFASRRFVFYHFLSTSAFCIVRCRNFSFQLGKGSKAVNGNSSRHPFKLFSTHLC